MISEMLSKKDLFFQSSMLVRNVLPWNNIKQSNIENSTKDMLSILWICPIMKIRFIRPITIFWVNGNIMVQHMQELISSHINIS